jgi:hypothetical protein
VGTRSFGLLRPARGVPTCVAADLVVSGGKPSLPNLLRGLVAYRATRPVPPGDPPDRKSMDKGGSGTPDSIVKG